MTGSSAGAFVLDVFQAPLGFRSLSLHLVVIDVSMDRCRVKTHRDPASQA